MRLFPILTAMLVVAGLYLLIFERERVMGFASGQAPALVADEDSEDPSAVENDTGVPVVALRSVAKEFDRAVVVRGQTEAARQVDVRAETTGLVISKPIRKGAGVEAGEPLCRIDVGTRESSLREVEARLQQAQVGVPEAEARVSEAEARLEEALINDRAAARLIEEGFASQNRLAATKAAVQSARAGLQTANSGLEAAEAAIRSAEAAVAAASKEIDRLTITAPFSGLLESDTAELGSLLQPGALCATVIQLDPIKLVGFVPETEVDRIKVGARAGARLATGREVAGTVTFLSRSADAATRTFRVEVEVSNSDLAIRDGQTAEIAIAADGASAHLIPQSALTLDDEGVLGVRVVAENQTASFLPVTVLRDTTRGVWLDGLPNQTAVIVVGQEFVTDGVPVVPTFRESGR